MKKILSIITFFTGFLGFSQTEIHIKYDEAGNQRYRGPDINGREKPKDPRLLEEKLFSTALNDQHKISPTIDLKEFWKQFRIYPVPVNDILTIDWTEEVDALIETVSLYQHSAVHWKFQQQNLPNLNKQLKINMTGYEWGVYILHIKLKDGRVFSRNITKR